MKDTQTSGIEEKEIFEAGTDIHLNQYVTFGIGDEVYGVPVMKVQEITGMTEITRIPDSAEFMKGMINLRGRVVPVIDMRLKFKMSEKKYDDFTVIIIIEVNDNLIGMIVDTVSDVAGIPDDSIQDTGDFSTTISTEYITGIANVDDQLIIILDSNRILNSEEIGILTGDI